MTTFLIDITNANLLFGFVPETTGLFFFGIILIILAMILRWFFNRDQKTETEKEFNQQLKNN